MRKLTETERDHLYYLTETLIPDLIESKKIAMAEDLVKTGMILEDLTGEAFGFSALDLEIGEMEEGFLDTDEEEGG